LVEVRERQRHQKPPRTDIGALRHAERDGKEEGGRCGVAHERAHGGSGQHQQQQRPGGVHAALAHECASHHIHHPRPLQGGGHDEQAQDEDDGMAAETGEGPFGREEPGEDERQQHAERGDVGRNLLRPENRNACDENQQKQRDLCRHGHSLSKARAGAATAHVARTTGAAPNKGNGPEPHGATTIVRAEMDGFVPSPTLSYPCYDARDRLPCAATPS
jgi:hypothetical protein